jgi:flagellar basal body-associated protein FliL
MQSAGGTPVPRTALAAPVTRRGGRGRRTRIIIAAAAALVVVAAAVTAIVLINRSNAAEAHKQAMETALSQMTMYIDNEHDVMFSYPSSWEQIPVEELGGMVDPSTAFVAFGDPYSPLLQGTPSSYLVFAGQETPGGVGVSARDVLEPMIRMFEDYGGDGFSTIEGVTDINAGGVRGAQATMAYEDSAQSVVMRICMLGEGGSFYMFMFGANESEWDENEQFFDATIESFVASAY